MKLKITKNGINRTIDSTANEMYSLYDALCYLEFLEIIKEEVQRDVQQNNWTTYTFPLGGFKIIDDKTLELFYFGNDFEYVYPLQIKQEELWKAVLKYQELRDLEWHVMTISYDGNEVHFEVE